MQYSQGIYIPGQSNPPPSSKKLILPGQDDRKSQTSELDNEPILTHSYSSLTGKEPTLTEQELIAKEADLKTKIQIAGIGDDNVPFMLMDIARECFKLGQIEKSLLYNQQLMIYLSTVKKGDNATLKLFIQTFQNIGQLLIRVGDPANGLKFIDQAIERMKTLSGTGHIDMAKLYNDQGLCNLYLEEFDKAISSYKDALALRKQLFGENRELETEDAIILNNLGVAQNYAEKYTEAVQTFRLAMSIYEKFADEKNLLYINSVENLGFAIGGTGDMNQQIDLLKKAIKLKSEHHPTRVIELANSQLQIGQSYEKMGQIDQAEQYYQQSLQTRKNFYGDKMSPDMGQTLLQIGQVKHAKQDFQTAKKYYNQALPHFDKKTSEHALVLNLLGAIHDTEGNFNDALEFHQKALQINQQLHGLKAYQNLVSLHNLCQVQEKLGNIDQALHYKEQIADIIIKSKRNSDVDIIAVLQELSNLQRKAQKFESALETNNQILDLAKKIYGDEEQNTAQVYQQLGEIYYELKNKEKSTENLQKCVDIRKKFLPESSNLIQDVKKQLLSLEQEL